MKVVIGKAGVIISGGIIEDDSSNCEVYSYGICTLKVKANSLVCVQCGKLVYSRCAGVKSASRNCEGNAVGDVLQGEALCDEVLAVREFGA